MQAIVLRNLGRDLPPYKEGQVIDADEKEIENLCRLGLAKVIEAVPVEPIQAVPPKTKKQRVVSKDE